jgi:hypothetical protein
MNIAVKFIVLIAFADNTLAFAQEIEKTKGSYLYYGQPAIEDNSIVVSEAFVQDSRSVQQIATIDADRDRTRYGYTLEVPLGVSRHQMSFDFAYYNFRKIREVGDHTLHSAGMEDLTISYAFSAVAKTQRVLLVPRIGLVIPTGSALNGSGKGGWGVGTGMSLGKRINKELLIHLNLGLTNTFHADHFLLDDSDAGFHKVEKNLTEKSVGLSFIWLATSRFNMMLECMNTFSETIVAEQKDVKNNLVFVIPGIRSTKTIGRSQVVPALAFPISFDHETLISAGFCLYFSVETSY